MAAEPLLRVEGLKKHFPAGQGWFGRGREVVRAVDGVDLSLRQGETLGLVGESGCGKTTLGRLILRLEEPTAGRVVFQGRDMLGLPPAELRRLRRDLQVIFQDPYSSLNPRKTAGRIIGEGFKLHGLASPQDRNRRVAELLETVGLRPEQAGRHPHEFSGGQRQRIGIARALALNPKLIVCDEPVSALDVSIQAQILNLLVSLQREFGLTYIFISHSLSVVRHLSDRVAVMYLGRLVEVAPSAELYLLPRHPYSQALIGAVPRIPRAGEEKKSRRTLAGDVPSPINPPSGCAFHPRCPARPEREGEACRVEVPLLREVAPGHRVACHFPWEGG